MANRKHLDILRQGVETWNRWRQQHPDIQPDLRGARLSGVYLGHANLSHANLSGAVLNRVNFEYAQLQGANLSGAELDVVGFRHAQLHGANLSGADLGASFFEEAQLAGADLRGANFEEAVLENADLRGAQPQDSLRHLQSRQRAATHFMRGFDDFSLRCDYQSALYQFNQAIQLDPEYAMAYSYRGLVYYELKEYQKALADFDRAIELEPESASTYSKRGALYRKLKEYQKALADYDRALQFENSYVDYNNRGLIYYELKEYQKALADFDHAIELEPESAMAYSHRGQVYYELKEYQKALADNNRSLELNDYKSHGALYNSVRAITGELDPRYVDYNNRGLTYYELKEYQKALADFDRAIELEPQRAKPYNNRGLVYYELKEYQKALADFDCAIELDPDNAIHYRNRGEVYYELKEYQKALADYDCAIQLDPDNTLARSQREKVYEVLKGTAEVTTQTYLERGKLALARGDAHEATTAYASVSQYEPNNPQAHLGLAQASLALGDFVAVHMACRRVQELQPTSGLESSLAQILLDLLDQKYDHAQQAIDQYTTQDFTNGYAHALRAYLLSITGKSYDADLARAYAAHLSQGATFKDCFPPETEWVQKDGTIENYSQPQAESARKRQWSEWIDFPENIAGLVYPILVSLKVGHPDITAEIVAGLTRGVAESLKEGKDPREEKTVVTILRQVVKAATPALTADAIGEVIKHLGHIHHG